MGQGLGWEGLGSLGQGLPPRVGRTHGGGINKGRSRIREGILTARTPTIKLAALEVSKLRKVSTFQGYTRFSHRCGLNSGPHSSFHIPPG